MAEVRVVLCDLGMGNLHSVERALVRAAEDAGVACAIERSEDPTAIARADKVVVPGQGAFRDCAAALERGWGEAIARHIEAFKPYFGICLGLQALFEESDEAPGARGLGVLRGRVAALAPAPGVKIPHMGWNRVSRVQQSAGPLAIFDGAEDPYFYFVHSYHAVPEDPSLIAAITEHGPHRITAAVHRGPLFATQFHPEKSQAAGLALLAAFLRGGEA
jgi:imidazole glycerol-phosphate synthase subunit HisH